MKLILASSSQRRRELMSMCGYEYTIEASGAEEKTEKTDPALFVCELAKQKAEDVFSRFGGESVAVLGADTVVYSEGSIIGKPKDERDARRILSRLSGKTHTVFTGVCIVTKEKTLVEYEKTEVKFCDLSSDEIEKYIRSGDPMDKAGSYGIQGPFGMFVERIDGNYFNVIGLPIPKVYVMLKEVGVLPRDFR